MPEELETARREGALARLADDPASRRRFLRGLGAGGAGAFAVFLGACGSDDDEEDGGDNAATQTETQARTQTQPAGGGDLEIVNYALTLEYLEADFYQQVIASGEVSGATLELAKDIGENEQEHVEALRATAMSLGTPVEAPQTNFDDVLAGGPEMILMTAATVENLGAAAYLGQAAAIQTEGILEAALAIHSVEARHAAALNQLAGRDFMTNSPLEGSIPDGAFAKPMTMEQVLEQAQPFLA